MWSRDHIKIKKNIAGKNFTPGQILIEHLSTLIQNSSHLFIVKLSKSKDKNRYYKLIRKGSIWHIEVELSDFMSQALETRTEKKDTFTVLKDKNSHPQIFWENYPSSLEK